MIAPTKTSTLDEHLGYLKLHFVSEHYSSLAHQAAKKSWPHSQYLEQLCEGEVHLRQDRSIKRRIAMARFPFIKTLDQFQWSWPTNINRPQVQHLFSLHFIKEHANVIFLGCVGLGKTHLGIALAYAACLSGHSVLFTTAMDAINSLSAVHGSAKFKAGLAKYLKPQLLIVDELGYLPIDKKGADLLFQIISERYEKGSMILTSNLAYKKWPVIFNNDSTLTVAILDRLLHHSETVTIEGKSYRMKDQIDP